LYRLQRHCYSDSVPTHRTRKNNRTKSTLVEDEERDPEREEREIKIETKSEQLGVNPESSARNLSGTFIGLGSKTTELLPVRPGEFHRRQRFWQSSFAATCRVRRTHGLRVPRVESRVGACTSYLCTTTTTKPCPLWSRARALHRISDAARASCRRRSRAEGGLGEECVGGGTMERRPGLSLFYGVALR